jgi:hypothetical protein
MGRSLRRAQCRYPTWLKDVTRQEVERLLSFTHEGDTPSRLQVRPPRASLQLWKLK